MAAPTSASSQGSEDSTLPSRRSDSPASDRSSGTNTAPPSLSDTGPESRDGEMLLPTPMVGDSKSARNATAKRNKAPPTGVHAGVTLTDLLATPSSHPRTHSPRDVDHGVQLANQVDSLLPTPTSNQPGGSAEQHLARKQRMPDGAHRTSVTDLRMALDLISSSGDTPASPSATLASEAAPTTRATYGLSSPVLLASFDPDGHCWRTFQATLALELPTFSQTLPRSGMTRRGRLYERPMSAHPTAESDGFASLRTPRATRGGSSTENAELLPSPRANKWGPPDSHGKVLAMFLPTPRHEGFDAGNHRGQPDSLNQTVRHLPTPKASDHTGPKRHGDGGPGLREVVQEASLGDLTEPLSNDGSE